MQRDKHALQRRQLCGRTCRSGAACEGCAPSMPPLAMHGPYCPVQFCASSVFRISRLFRVRGRGGGRRGPHFAVQASGVPAAHLQVRTNTAATVQHRCAFEPIARCSWTVQIPVGRHSFAVDLIRPYCLPNLLPPASPLLAHSQPMPLYILARRALASHAHGNGRALRAAPASSHGLCSGSTRTLAEASVAYEVERVRPTRPATEPTAKRERRARVRPIATLRRFGGVAPLRWSGQSCWAPVLSGV